MSSIWKMDIEIQECQPLTGTVKTDVVIIGAGMAGLLTAYLLKEKGINAIVIDEKQVARGTTCNTTAKITSQHDLIYDQLINDLGKERAKQYAQANELAVKKFAQIAEHMDCDFVSCPSYVYSLKDPEKIYKEVKAAGRLGIAAEFTTETELPFKVLGAVKFPNQARFHPLKFIQGICQELNIYEHTKAWEIKDKTVICKDALIKAQHIVIATHFPFINTPGYYFLRLYQSRSYVLALENAQQMQGMYVDEETDGLSFRNHQNLLLLGGFDHRTGESDKSPGFKGLRETAKRLYPNAKEVAAWATQDCMPLDDVPYIGRYSKKFEHIYVATGFRKWGMTGSMVSAMIISDLISGKDNPYSEVFSPQRSISDKATRSVLVNTYKTAVHFVSQHINLDPDRLKEIAPNSSGIIEHKKHKYGVFRDENGAVFAVSTKCPAFRLRTGLERARTLMGLPLPRLPL